MDHEQSAQDYAVFDKFIQLRYCFLVSGALHVAAELGVADILSDGPKMSDEVECGRCAPRVALTPATNARGSQVFEEDAARRIPANFSRLDAP